jgi:hypothetical protein
MSQTKTAPPKAPGAAEPAEAHKPKKQRSPNYPLLDLDSALKATKQILDKEGLHFAPATVVATKHWGFTAKSSAWMLRLAALKAFGLVDEQGSGTGRQIRVSELGKRILQDKRDVSPDRDKAMREAALRPKVHRDLWEQYGASLPSDETVETRLVMDKGFTDQAASALLKRYKATMAFAKLESEGPIEDDAGTPGEDDEQPQKPPGQSKPPARGAAIPGVHMRDVTIPLPSGAQATLNVPSPMSVADFNLLKDALALLQPGLTAVDRPQPTAPAADRDAAEVEV